MSRWFSRVWAATRSVILRRHAERELDEEMQFHLEREIDEQVRTGLPSDAARHAALRAMGAIEKNKEECRDLRRGSTLARFISILGQDVRFGARLFRRHPAAAGVATGGLALAIAVVTAVFSIVNASMLRPYGMDDPSSVISIARAGHSRRLGLPYAQFLRMREETTLATIEASLETTARFSAVPTEGDVPRRPVAFISGGYLSVLGGRPALGRSLQPADDAPTSPPVIVVSDYFWRTQLNSDASIVGKTVRLNDTPVTLVGVLQPEFTGPTSTPPSIWAPFAAFDDLQMGAAFTPTAAPSSVDVIARRLPDAANAAIEENLNAIRDRARTAYGGASTSAPGDELAVQSAASPMAGAMDADTFVGLVSVLSIAALVLALACVNAANLLMAAAVTRVREIGVRLALGATRARLVRQLVTESLLLGLIAGGLGFLLAFWLVPICGAMVEMPPEIDLAPDGYVLLGTIGVALICGLGAGLVPARHGARGNVLAALQSQSGGRGGATIPSRFRRTFVGFQAAVSMLLLVCAALLVRTAMRVTNTDAGFDVDRLVNVSLDDAPHAAFDQVAYSRLALAAARQIPSVQRVSATQHLPFGYTVEHDRFSYEGHSYQVIVIRSDAEFLSTAGIRVLRGRPFTTQEIADESPVALISERVAHAFFAGRDPIGQSLLSLSAMENATREPARIVGVVADAQLSRPDSERYGALYRPISDRRIVERRDNAPGLLVRSATPAATARTIEVALRGIDPRVRPSARLVRDGVDAYVGGMRRLAWLLAPTAILALLLAVLGVYGVTAFIVGQRTEEVSVRLAVGASSADVLWLLVKDSLRPVGIGLLVGLGLALLVGQLFARELAGVSPRDPLAIGVAFATLLTCALVAVIIPARRASRANPAALLR